MIHQSAFEFACAEESIDYFIARNLAGKIGERRDRFNLGEESAQQLWTAAHTSPVAEDKKLPTIGCAHSGMVPRYAALFLPRVTRGERETSPSLSMKYRN